MATPETDKGLRERKKLKTRHAIRRAALTLFAERGYSDTTVEQIAEAADISPRTFYRYFNVKEAVLLTDEQIEPIVEAFAKAPAELSIVAAYRHAIAEVFGEMTDEERESAATAQRLMYQVPEARGLLYTEYVRLLAMITEAMANRHDAPPDPASRRVIAAAIVGVLIAAAHDTPMPEDTLFPALTILDQQLRGPA